MKNRAYIKPLTMLKDSARYLKNLFGEPDNSHNKLKARDLLFFGRFLKPVWKLAMLSFCLALSMTVIKSVAPLGGKIFIDYIVLNQGYGQLETAISMIGMGSLAQNVIQFFGSMELIILSMIIGGLTFGALGTIQSYITMRYGQELTFSLQKTLFERSLRFPLTIFKTKQTGYVVSRIMGDVNSLQGFFSATLVNVFSSLFFLAIGASVMFLMSPKITLIILGLSPLYLLVSLYFSGRVRSASYSEAEKSVQVFKHMQEVLSGVEVVKTNTAEDREASKVAGKMRLAVQTRLNNYMITATSAGVLRTLQFGVVILITWFGYGEIRRGTMTLGDFAAFSSYAYLLSGSINNLFSTITNIQPSLASMDRLKEMFDIEPEDAGEDKPKIRRESVRGEIRFERVAFAYEANKPVLKDLNFTIEAGETVTLVGPSGLGKTTIASLLLKFYTPQAGAIYLDGHDLRDIDTAWLRQQIGVVSQDIFLFDDTIESNIRYGRPSATPEEVIEAAKAAGIHSSITGFPDGYQTIVGERGAKLSTGQRQRISIARAFLRNAPILVMDEPTSALDMETEQVIKESLKELVKGKTTLIITHRLSMTEVADKVLTIGENKTADGSLLEEPVQAR